MMLRLVPQDTWSRSFWTIHPSVLFCLSFFPLHNFCSSNWVSSHLFWIQNVNIIFKYQISGKFEYVYISTEKRKWMWDVSFLAYCAIISRVKQILNIVGMLYVCIICYFTYKITNILFIADWDLRDLFRFTPKPVMVPGCSSMTLVLPVVSYSENKGLPFSCH